MSRTKSFMAFRRLGRYAYNLPSQLIEFAEEGRELFSLHGASGRVVHRVEVDHKVISVPELFNPPDLTVLIGAVKVGELQDAITPLTGLDSASR